MFSWRTTAKKQTRVCCFHFGRCGSTLLGNMAGGHPQIEWRGELFHELHEGPDKSDPWRHLQGPLGQVQKRVFGFETKFQHLDGDGLNLTFEEYINHLVQLGFSRFIVLWRSNYLRQAISVARGQQSGKWHYRETDPAPENFAVHLDVSRLGLGGKDRSLLECFEFLDATYRRSAEVLKGHEHMDLNYEDDLLNDASIGYRKLMRQLGLRYSKPQIDLQRIGHHPVKQMLSNFDQVAQILSGTQYAWMLDE